MECTSCGAQRATLTTKKSAIWPAMELYLCSDCLANKREPRFLIILVARTSGIDEVRQYISPKRYIGPDIKLDELV